MSSPYRHKFLVAMKKEIEELEENIAILEAEISQMDYANQENSSELLNRFELVKKELDEKMSEWEETVKLTEGSQP